MGFIPGWSPRRTARILGFAYVLGLPHAGRAYRWTVETGVYLAADAQGRGLGPGPDRSACSSLLDRPGVHGRRWPAITLAQRRPACGLHEKLGFAPTATYRETGFKLGAWRTVQVFARDLAPRLTPPSEIRPFADVW